MTAAVDSKTRSSIALVGWFILFTALIAVLLSLVSLVLLPPELPFSEIELQNLTHQLGWPFQVLFALLKKSRIVSLVQLVTSAVVALISIAFLSYRSWARKAVEILCWFGIVFTTALLIYFTAFVLHLTPAVSRIDPGARKLLLLTKLIFAASSFIVVVLSYLTFILLL